MFDRENVTLAELLTAAECDGTVLGLFLKMRQMWIRATRIWYLFNGPTSRPNCCRAALLFRAEKGDQELMGLTITTTIIIIIFYCIIFS